MENPNIKIEINEQSLKELLSEATRNLVSSGDVEIECPSCGKPIVAAIGDSICPHCGTPINLSTGEPEL